MTDLFSDFFDVAETAAKKTREIFEEEAAARRAEEEREKNNALKRGKLVTICRESGFDTIVDALSDLPVKEGKIFYASVKGGDEGSLWIWVSEELEKNPKDRPDSYIRFHMRAEDAITCTVVAPYLDARTTECRSMKEVNEQLAQWFGALLPDRVAELQERMSPKKGLFQKLCARP